MSDSNKKEKTVVHLNIPSELYSAYKEALRQNIPYYNATQDIIAHMRRVVENTAELNQTK